MAQPRRVLVLRAQPQSLDQHQLYLRRRTRIPDRLLGLPLERQPRALRLDQTRRRDPRQSRPRTRHPRPDHQTRDTPLDEIRVQLADDLLAGESLAVVETLDYGRNRLLGRKPALA